MSKRYKSEVKESIHSLASDLYRGGGIDKTEMRYFDEACLTPIVSFSPFQIRHLRTKNKASQAVFARYLGITTGLVSQWERGEKKPSGPSLKLLALVKKGGLEAIA